MKVVSDVTGSDNVALLPIDGPVPADYQKFLDPERAQWVATVSLAAGTDQWILSVQRSIAQGPFLPDERRELAKLSSSLSTAAALARTLGFSAAKIALEAFELSGTPIMLLNRAGEPIEFNRQAEGLLGTGISISKKRLVSDTPDATEALDRALHASILANGTALTPPVRFSRAGRQPLLAYPLKLSSLSKNVFAEC